MKLDHDRQRILIDIATVWSQLQRVGEPEDTDEYRELSRLKKQRDCRRREGAETSLDHGDSLRAVARLRADRARLVRRIHDNDKTLAASTDEDVRREARHDKQAAEKRLRAIDAQLAGQEQKLAATSAPSAGETQDFAEAYRAAEEAYRVRRQQIETGQEAVRERLEAMLATLDPADVKELRAQTRSTGVCAVVFSGRSCAGCQMVLSPAEVKTIEATDKDEVARCPQCGTFLVLGGDHTREGK